MKDDLAQSSGSLAQDAGVKERPILMSAPMVRAILANTKTQTRRVVKWRGLEPGLNLGFSGLRVECLGSNWVLTIPTRTSWENRSSPMLCPYGHPGDRGGNHLWVRETWAAPHAFDHLPPRLIPAGARFHYRATEDAGGLRWRPSIFMPRWASRILLEVTEVHVERLQSISEADAKAEGAPDYEEGIDAPPLDKTCVWSYRSSYLRVWETINGPESWDANPWVWAVSFRNVSKDLAGA